MPVPLTEQIPQSASCCSTTPVEFETMASRYPPAASDASTPAAPSAASQAVAIASSMSGVAASTWWPGTPSATAISRRVRGQSSCSQASWAWLAT